MKESTISALIIDDESHARVALQHLLKDHPQIEILAECENGKEAVKAVNDLNPDVIFLDIHMPKLDGFEVLELLGDHTPLVVFVTAYDEYAIQAFKSNAVDYLLKPVSKDRLAASVKRIEERKGQAQTEAPKNKAVIAEMKQHQGPLRRLLIRDKDEVHVIATSDVIAIEAADDYVVIHIADQSHIKQDRLSKLEEQLDSQLFCRIHRSTLINLDFLKSIEMEGKDSRFATMKDGSQYAISRSGYGKLVERL